MLAQLQSRYPLAVVSNKPDRAVKELAAVYFPNLYARGESTDCPRKPAPDMVWQAMQALEVERCIYVGDSDVDIMTAQRAGVPCISVTWGFRGEQELLEAGATHICRKPEDLPRVIEGILNR